ncbi:hypothetical protein TWF225_011866 [Orbilia oligospora]|nr:hypothetical protein TWF751_011798 [Orbilia oligospora]KAF3167949.1 hypothetical protein TWF225_011866 [Orbilia oligospora]KAF3234020.1 hypothetical protein TWF128_002632 [Orbilia oligospora]KAF3254973.1 hypothetical protein TWF217_006676 [Orbilia oligospora]KAF3280716.1 hypothetical protein TWF132_011464 [Orbilia oligospora]
MASEARTSTEIKKVQQPEPKLDLQTSSKDPEKQPPTSDSKENQTKEDSVPSSQKLEHAETWGTFYADVGDAESQQERQEQQQQQEEPLQDVEPKTRRHRFCKCLCIIMLLFIIVAAIGGGLISYGAMGCFKKENKGKKKCLGKGRNSKTSDASFVSMKGSWGMYMIMFLFEIMMFVIF